MHGNSNALVRVNLCFHRARVSMTRQAPDWAPPDCQVAAIDETSVGRHVTPVIFNDLGLTQMTLHFGDNKHKDADCRG